MTKAMVGVIGGTGLGDAITRNTDGQVVEVDTPYGPPSCPLIVTNWEGVDVAVLLRHGHGHRFNPSTVPYRANIWALKKLGVSAIIASGATGSLREEIEPGHVVLCDQVIDRTHKRDSTFFDEGLVVHVEFSEPFCPRLRAVLQDAGTRVHTRVHAKGTYVCMEGPQFSTRAESLLHRQWGGDLIGMTCMPEAKLAREAEISYALVALPTDYDAWRPHDPNKPPDSLLEEIMGNLRRASDNAVELVHEALRIIGKMPEPWQGPDSLKLAIWSDLARVDAEVRRKLEPMLQRYLDK